MIAGKQDNDELGKIDQYQKRLGGKITPFYIRLIAFLIDSIIKLGIFFVFFLKFPDELHGLKPMIIATLIGMVYETLFLYSKLKATPGKLLMGIKVVNSRGEKLTLIRSLYRFVCRFFSIYVFGIGFFYALTDIYKRAYHCNISRSYVISTRHLHDDEPLVLDDNL